MCEDVCRTVHIARQLGEPKPDRAGRRRPPVRPLPERLRTAASDDRPDRPVRRARGLVPHRQPVPVRRGDARAGGRRRQREVVAAARRPRRRARCGSSAKPVLTTADAIRRACLDARHDDRCIGVIAWMHTFSPAKMWIGGLQALGKPLLHLHTQANESLPWSTIDMDFMNLNQAAHGDREFALRADPDGPRAQDRVRPRERTRGPGVGRSVGARRGRAPHAPHLAPRPLRRQHAQRRRDRGRQGRGRDPLRRVGQHVGRERPGRRGRPGRRAGGRRLWSASTRTPTRWPPSCGPAATATSRCGSPRPSRWACAAFLEAGGFGAFTTNFEDLGGLRQLPGLAVQRLMADGYGFGGEGDWKTAALLRTVKVMGEGLPGRHVLHGGLHVPPRSRRPRRRSAPTCSRSARRSPAAGRPARCTRSAIGGREDPVRLVFDAAPGPAVVVGLADLGEPLPARRQPRSTPWSPTSRCPTLPVARAVWTSRPDLRGGGDRVAHRRRPAPHRLQPAPSTGRPSTTSPRSPGWSWPCIHAGTTVIELPGRAAVERRVAPPRPGSVTPARGEATGPHTGDRRRGRAGRCLRDDGVARAQRLPGCGRGDPGPGRAGGGRSRLPGQRRGPHARRRPVPDPWRGRGGDALLRPGEHAVRHRGGGPRGRAPGAPRDAAGAPIPRRCEPRSTSCATATSTGCSSSLPSWRRSRRSRPCTPRCPTWWSSGDPSAGLATVAIDQEAGARLATRHLLDLGHTTVHHVRGPAELDRRQRPRRRAGGGSCGSRAGRSAGPSPATGRPVPATRPVDGWRSTRT